MFFQNKWQMYFPSSHTFKFTNKQLWDYFKSFLVVGEISQSGAGLGHSEPGNNKWLENGRGRHAVTKTELK